MWLILQTPCHIGLFMFGSTELHLHSERNNKNKCPKGQSTNINEQYEYSVVYG
jgi:hypothetical protein